MDIRFLGHACFELSDGDTRVLIDPFLTGNPKAAVEAGDVDPTHIFLTHGHADHIGDTVDIAKRTGAQTVAIVELANELDGDGWVRYVPAWHTAVSPKGTAHMPAGIVIGIGGKVVYHLGDTTLFSDLALPGRRDDIDVALMCIGGHYTMDRHDGVRAAELVGAKRIIPCHYGTFPPIETDAEAFKREVETASDAKVVILEPGDTHSE